MAWRDPHVIPRYGAAGGATLRLPDAVFTDTGEEAFEGPAVFPTKWFVDRQQALDWLRA